MTEASRAASGRSEAEPNAHSGSAASHASRPGTGAVKRPELAGQAAGGNDQAAPSTVEPAAGRPAAAGGRLGEERIVVRDKRKIDSGTAKAKPVGGEAGSGAGSPAGPDAVRPTAERPTVEKPSADGRPAEPVEPVEVADVADVVEPAEPVEVADVVEPAEVPDVVEVAEPAEVAEVAEPVEVAEPEAVPAAADAELAVDAEPTVDAEPAADAGAARPAALGAELQALRSELAERTDDLQRVTAEYANYRKRVDRDRGLVADQAVGSVLAALLPILDDLDRAREHGDLTGPFGSVAEQLTTALGKFGLTPFGEQGDLFDPTRHEAVAHQTSPEVTEPTCVDVLRRGYLMGDRLLRPALVAVADPE